MSTSTDEKHVESDDDVSEEEEDQEQKCYNCEGVGHIAKRCASNRDVLKFAENPVECRRCTGKGHYEKYCTTKDPSIVCFRCGKYYHKAFECRTPVGGRRGNRGQRGRGSRGRGRDYKAVDNSTVKCFSCNEVGHISYECPDKSNSTRGHVRGRGGRGGRGRGRGRGKSNNVGRTQDTSSAKCFICNETGHLSYDCTAED